MANLRHCLQFPSFLSFLDILGRQVSLYLRPQMHLFAILENSTLRRDCDLLRQVSLYQSVRQRALSIPGLFDAIGLFTVEELVETENARLIVVGVDFARILLSPSFCSCILFAIVSVRLIKL